MRRKRLTVMLLIMAGATGAVLVVLWVRRPPVLYEVIFLKTTAGEPIIPHSINERGQVVGLVESPDRRQHIFRWDKDHGPQDLGPYRIQNRSSLRVNDAGQILAQVIDANGTSGSGLLDPNGQERRWDDWKSTGHQWSALNSRGQLAGCRRTSTGAIHAAIWDPGRGVRDLGTLGGPHSFAVSINDKGQVAGFSETTMAAEIDVRHIFFWDPSTGMRDLGLMEGIYGKRVHVNEREQVAGAFDVGPSPARISLWSRAQGRRPGPVMEEWFGAEVVAFNDVDQLLLHVHSADITLGEEYFGYRIEGYLWDPNQGFVSLRRHLGHRGIRAFRARDLNNRGQIVGELELRASKRTHGVLLEPLARHDGRAQP